MDLADRVAAACALLEANLRATRGSSSTHDFITVTGLQESDEVLAATATYLLGLRVVAIDSLLAVQTELLPNPVGPTVTRNVESLIGGAAGLSAAQKRDERNPWMAEAISHLCLRVSRVVGDLHPPGYVVAADHVHGSAKEQGLDIVGLYREDGGGLGVTIAEVKAYEQRPSVAVTDAAAMFRDIDADIHDIEVRRILSILRERVPAADRARLTAAVWTNTRAYQATPYFDQSCAVDWTFRRPALASLSPPKERTLISSNGLEDFKDYFDSVADHMRTVASELDDV